MAQVLKDKCRLAIIDAAKKQFLEKGYKEASMRSIAKAANMTVGNLYRYFDSKEDISKYIVETTLNKLDEVITSLTKTNISVETRVFSAKFSEAQLREVFDNFSEKLVNIYIDNKDEFNILFMEAKINDRLIEWFSMLINEIIKQTYRVEIYVSEISIISHSYAISIVSGLRDLFLNKTLDNEMLKRLVKIYFRSYIYMFDADINKIIND